MYEDDPEYERRRQALSSCLDRLEVIRDPEARDLLWDAVLRFTDQSDLVSFAHGPSVVGPSLALGTERSEPASSSAPVPSRGLKRSRQESSSSPSASSARLDSSAFLLRLPLTR